MMLQATLNAEAVPTLHLCEHLLVVNKPAGLPSDQTRDPRRDTLFSRVQTAWREAGEPGEKPALMHRLDRDTTGCVLFALSAAARASVTDALRGRAFEKRYLAVVRDAASIDDLLPQGGPRVVRVRLDAQRTGKVDRQVVVTRGGQHSESHVLLRQRFEAAIDGRPRAAERRALLEIRLVTGRRHQIRAHLAHLGLPVVGDPLYSSGCATGDGRPAVRENCEPLMLHAWMLGIPESVAGGPLIITAPAPPTFADCGAPAIHASGF